MGGSRPRLSILQEDMTNSLSHLEPSICKKKMLKLVTAAIRRHKGEEDGGERGRKTQESQFIPPTVSKGEGVGAFLLQVPACTKLLPWAVDLQSRAWVAGDPGVEFRDQETGIQERSPVGEYLGGTKLGHPWVIGF